MRIFSANERFPRTFRCIDGKSVETTFKENFLIKKSNKKARYVAILLFLEKLVILSIFHMNYLQNTFKHFCFKIKIKINVNIVDFLDLILNLNNGTYTPYKKPNDKILYVNTSSNHPPQIIKTYLLQSMRGSLKTCQMKKYLNINPITKRS